MTKNCWNSQALAEISCYLAFAGAMLYLVRSGRYLSYVTPKLAPYLCFSAAVMVVWALSSLGRVFRIQYRKHIAHCFVLAIPASAVAAATRYRGPQRYLRFCRTAEWKHGQRRRRRGRRHTGHRKPHTVQSGGY